MTPLSSRQQQVQGFVREHVRDEGFPPTLSEIAEGVGLTRISTVNYHLNALMRQGWINVRPNTRRGIRLLHTELPAIATDPIPAGEPLLAESRVVRRIHEDVAGCFSPPDYFVFVSGDSLDRVGLKDDDLAAIRRVPAAQPGQVVIARVDDEVTLGRYEPVDERYVRLVPDSTNKQHRPRRIDRSRTRFAIDGVVVGATIPRERFGCIPDSRRAHPREPGCGRRRRRVQAATERRAPGGSVTLRIVRSHDYTGHTADVTADDPGDPDADSGMPVVVC